MSPLDFVVLIGSMVAIAVYGMWRTRGQQDLNTYLKGDPNVRWAAIGISVMATQASAITFISTPGQGYQDGLGFVQNYFGMPLALIIIAAVFLPMYRRLNVYTAYEFLGHRFDNKTRLLGAALFLLQRGLAAGITIYAPAIILSTMLGWRLDLTIVLSGLLVIIYTVTGWQRSGDPHPEIPVGRNFWWNGNRLRRPVDEVAVECLVDRCPHRGGGLQETAGGGFFARCQTALHFLVRLVGWPLLVAIVFRHGSIPGATLYFRSLATRKPAWSYVQCRVQNPHAVLYSPARSAGVCVLPV